MVEPVFFIGLFDIDLYIPILQSLRMNDFRTVIKGEEWIHHCSYILPMQSTLLLYQQFRCYAISTHQVFWHYAACAVIAASYQLRPKDSCYC